MFEWILDLGMSLDWMSPLSGFVLDRINGPACHFGVSKGDASAAYGVLKEYGIDAWGLMFIAFEDIFMFAVPLDNALFVYECLFLNGVPVSFTSPHVNIEESTILTLGALGFEPTGVTL